MSVLMFSVIFWSILVFSVNSFDIFHERPMEVRRDYTCLCKPRIFGDPKRAQEAINCIYSESRPDCKDKITKIDTFKTSEEGWTLMHHAAASGNIDAARLILQYNPTLYYHMSKSREHEIPPSLPENTTSLCGLQNIWGWQPFHVAAAFDNAQWLKWVMSVPEPLESILLRHHLNAEDVYNRTAFVVALDQGKIRSLTALTSHPFSSPDIYSAVIFGINSFVRAKRAGEATFKWYKSFIQERRDLTVEIINNFYKVWPLPQVLLNKRVQRKLNATRISAWPPVFHIQDFLPKNSTICDDLIRDSIPITSRKNTFGPQSMFGGVPRHEIPALMEEYDKNHDGVLDVMERDEFIRFLMNRETGGVKELLGFRIPTGRISMKLGLDINGDGLIEYRGAERVKIESPGFLSTFNYEIFEEAKRLEARVIRTQQSARLSTAVGYRLRDFAISKLKIPPWLDVQFQVIRSLPPGEHYGHHDDGSHRVFTIFLYCKAAKVGGSTAFPFAIALEKDGEYSDVDRENVKRYRSLGACKKFRERVYLHEKCEEKRDCCDPDCHAIYRGQHLGILTKNNKGKNSSCIDDEISLRANLISVRLLNSKFFQGNGTCAYAGQKNLCHNRKLGWIVQKLCPMTCKVCDSEDAEVPRVIPTTGSVQGRARRGDVLIWPNYEHRTDGRVSQLPEAGHCGCPVRAGEKWSGNLWFKIPKHYLLNAMHMIIRGELVAIGRNLGSFSLSSERKSTFEALDSAIEDMHNQEAAFEEKMIFLTSVSAVCQSFLEVREGSNEFNDLFKAALELENTVFGFSGSRKMRHYSQQFQWYRYEKNRERSRCKRMSPQCELSSENQCFSTKNVGFHEDNRKCEKECGVCGLPSVSICEDVNSECSVFAAQGRCRHESRVRTECAASCGLCSISDVLDAPDM